MHDYFYPLAMSSWDQEEIELACEVIRSQRTTMGDKVKQFENNFSSYLGCDNTYMVNSGSSANLLMAMALKVYLEIHNDKRSTILIPAVGWSTSYSPFIQLGFNVKLVDVSLSTYNIDIPSILNSIDPDVAAILAINILGNPAPLVELQDICESHHIFLLEDNCESLGAEIISDTCITKAGNFGVMSTHSFFFSHHINTMEGGAVSTSNQDFSLLLKIIRNHGWIREISENDFVGEPSLVKNHIRNCINKLAESHNHSFMKSFYFILPGFNLRPTEIQGALGVLQLSKLSDFLTTRRENALYLKQQIENINYLTLQSEYHNSSFFGFGFVVDDVSRDHLVDYLDKNGVQVRPIVSGNILYHPLSSYMKNSNTVNNAPIIHKNGFFVGNHHVCIASQIDQFKYLLTDFQSI